MAVQARHYPHDQLLLPTAAAGGGSLLLDEYAGCVPAPARIGDAAATTAALSDFPRGDLAWCSNGGGFLPRKRPRGLELEAAGGVLLADPQRAGGMLSPPGTQRLLPVPPLPPFVDVRSRAAVGSGAAPSTSGRVTNGATTTTNVASRDDELLSAWTRRHCVDEIDALVTLEAERMRAALEEARRRHTRALLAAVGRAASGRLRAAEAGLERALRRNAELEEKARQAAAECEAWVGVARSHGAVAAGLRATLDQLVLQSPGPGCCLGGGGAGGEAEDAQSSCCFDSNAEDDGGGASMPRPSSKLACRSCGGGEACVLLLPCRHLCLCRVCEAAADACPVCATTKNGSLHVLFS